MLIENFEKVSTYMDALHSAEQKVQQLQATLADVSVAIDEVRGDKAEILELLAGVDLAIKEGRVFHEIVGTPNLIARYTLETVNKGEKS